jgi:hypothetical protein
MWIEVRKVSPREKDGPTRLADQEPVHLVFRSVPVLLIISLLGGSFGLWGLVHLVINLEEFGGFHSFSVWVALALLVTYCTIAIGAVIELWQVQWTFVLMPSHLTGSCWLTGRRFSLPWSSIHRVTRLRRGTQWQPQWGPEIVRGNIAFNAIEATDGQKIVFGNHVSRYRTFLDELRVRATNCREFDPYPE